MILTCSSLGERWLEASIYGKIFVKTRGQALSLGTTSRWFCMRMVIYEGVDMMCTIERGDLTWMRNYLFLGNFGTHQ